MLKKILLLPCCLFISLSSACVSHASQGNDNPAFAPDLNPHPKYFMTVKGHVAPSLIKPIGLQIVSTFDTNNPKCEYDASGGLEGAMFPHQKSITTSIQFDEQGNFETKVPIDYYQPGRCQWFINDMAYQIQLPDSGPIGFATFTHSKNLPAGFNTSIFTKVVCDGSLICSWVNIGNFTDFLPINHNYVYQIDFERK